MLVCKRCGRNTFTPRVKKETRKRSERSRLRMCKTCNPIQGKLRNRDIQALRNIFELIHLKYYGFPRPLELLRKKRDDNDHNRIYRNEWTSFLGKSTSFQILIVRFDLHTLSKWVRVIPASTKAPLKSSSVSENSIVLRILASTAYFAASVSPRLDS